MGRKSTLTEKQWAEIEKRLLDGESGRALAKAFGISESAIRKRLGAQIRSRPLADRLMSISEHLAGAAAYGIATARRLSGIANAQVAKIETPIKPRSRHRH